ncbi:MULTISPECIES: hypothetical protein [Pseudomonas]|uniref:hypothetical protein n=1 Tax=Pseudomonas TaxID=286 RepID=UPI001CECC169|nr:MULTISPECIES: hypothetical protein [Pseudomonas]
MVRTHTLVEYRLKEFELEQTLRTLKKQQESLDYKLDVEFYLKLEALAKDYGYSFSQVYDLLESRGERAARVLVDDTEGLRAKTNTELLEMVQRIGVTSPSHQSNTIHADSERDVDREWGASSSDAQHQQATSSDIASREDRVREKVSE